MTWKSEAIPGSRTNISKTTLAQFVRIGDVLELGGGHILVMFVHIPPMAWQRSALLVHLASCAVIIEGSFI